MRSRIVTTSSDVLETLPLIAPRSLLPIHLMIGKYSLHFAAAALMLLVDSVPLRAGDAHDLWILSGQSNACGRAKLPGPAPHPLVTMFDAANNQHVPARDPLPHMGTTGVGPWVAAATAVASESGIPIRMCGFASGGKPISFWHPGQPGHRGLFSVIQQAGTNADVLLWYQGESDARGRLTTAQYQQELTAHVNRVREAAGNPEMLVVVVQLGPMLRDGVGGFMAIREAQRQFVMQDAHAILVPALGRTLKDSVHLDNSGYRELGRELARAVLTVRGDERIEDWPGPILDDAVLMPDSDSRDRRTVVAHFGEVRELRHVLATDFAVIDAEGTNLCSVLTAGHTIVTLTCARDVVLPAKLVYGFGSNPSAALTDEAGNRAPAVQFPIRLGDAPREEATSIPNGAGVRVE